MRTQQPTSPPPPSTSARRPLLLALVLTLLLIGGASAFLATRGSDNTSPQAAPPPPVPPTTSPPTTSLDERAEVVARLREILRIRDEAYERRDEVLLQSIYTDDCPCLRSDREIIEDLRKNGQIWVSSVTTMKVEKLERVTSRQWIIVGVLTALPFHIKDESGRLIEKVPQESNSVRLALAKPVSSKIWLLGNASLIGKAS
jgi:hypothetical protein